MRGKAVFASDIYSLGATCINLLTVRSPFDSYDINNDTWVWQQYLQTPVSNQLSCILNKMLESIPIRRYQTVDEVINDLNQQSPVAAKPAAAPKPIPQSPPTFVSLSPSQIDQELEEMKTQFLGSNKPQTNKIQPPIPTSVPTSRNEIDQELEELKAKYLGNNNP
jgi:serine/threonine protein kinase